jgi:hypothetical protein
LMISENTHSGSGKVRVSDDRCLPGVFSVRGGATLADFVLGVLSSEVKTIRLTFGTSFIWQWRLPSRFLVEGIIWRLKLL